MDIKNIRKTLDDLIAADFRLRAIRKKIDSGKADFNDTSKYSEVISELLGRVLSENVLALGNDSEEACKQLLRDNYDKINSVLAQVQSSLDKRQGINIAAKRAAFPADRTSQLAHSLLDKGVTGETVRRRAGSASNISMSFHDDYIEENAKLRNDAGLRCYITRQAVGKCCDWCASITGRYLYDYSELPDDIFRRHDNCNCICIYENGRQRQDVWTKKSWEVLAFSPPKFKPTILKDGDVKAAPTVFSREQAKALQERNLAQIHKSSIDNSGESDIIKSIDVDDYKLITYGKGVLPEVSDKIVNTMKKM